MSLLSRKIEMNNEHSNHLLGSKSNVNDQEKNFFHTFKILC
jgi:hypothetical protein